MELPWRRSSEYSGCTELSIVHNAPPLLLMTLPFDKSQIVAYHVNFTLTFTLLLGRQFHKIKSRENSGSHNNLRTTDHNVELAELLWIN
jgi:hypothetical protein